MKKLVALLSILLFTSCQIESTGPTGPEGPPGPPGPVGQGFEVEADFTPSNGYSQIFGFPSNIEVLSTDIVVVYWLYEVDGDTGNDVWQQLPATIYFQDGQFQYAFDHTVADVQLFLQGNIDLNSLGPGFTQDQIFRVAVLPVDYVQGNDVDLSDIDEVMNAVGKGNFDRLQL